MFNCKSIDKLETSITTLLKESKSLTEATDLYHAFLLNRDAKSFGLKPSADFTKALTEKNVKDVLDKFNADDWSYNGQSFSVDSLRIVELLSSVNNTNADTKIKAALNKLLP